ncbi:MAG: sensor hybrid histidine kinase [Phycisphaerales bacterium]|nr:sensor hybrid histidine kinase [Phycisphaerales bacterium]
MNATDDPQHLATRVLVLAPTARDGQVTRALLERASLHSLVCTDLHRLSAEILKGAGAALITEEAIAADGIQELLDILGNQPTWSELPVLVLMRGGVESSSMALRVLRSLANVTLLERPAPMRSVISAAQTAVRSRLRQYQIRDQIREIRQLLESERAARAEAERAGRMKDEFLATLSHELRTPLNAILGWATMLRRSPDDAAEVASGIEVIERNARLQAQLIEDLLDMSRIISGKIRLDVRSVDPTVVIDAAVESIRPAADAKEIRVQHVIDPCGAVLGDPGRLQQVLWNLLSNAVKFTPRGGRIMITCRRSQSSVEISVTDSGQGIKPEFLPHVFERFRQADASTTRRYGGLGLGLAIVKNLVELHGGTVEARSNGEGSGATFIVSLPISALRTTAPDDNHDQAPSNGERAAARAFSASTLECDRADLTGIKVLVVDDDADARNLVKRLLGDCNAQVTAAASADEAFRCLKNELPDILLSDIGMPAMDGYEFIRQVRESLASGDRLPAAALTAFARSEDRRRALLAGYQTHVVKPVEPSELVAVVASLARRIGPALRPATSE